MKQVQFGLVSFSLVHGMLESGVRMFGEIRAEKNVDIFCHKARGLSSRWNRRLASLVVDRD